MLACSAGVFHVFISYRYQLVIEKICLVRGLIQDGAGLIKMCALACQNTPALQANQNVPCMHLPPPLSDFLEERRQMYTCYIKCTYHATLQMHLMGETNFFAFSDVILFR